MTRTFSNSCEPRLPIVPCGQSLHRFTHLGTCTRSRKDAKMQADDPMSSETMRRRPLLDLASASGLTQACWRHVVVGPMTDMNKRSKGREIAMVHSQFGSRLVLATAPARESHWHPPRSIAQESLTTSWRARPWTDLQGLLSMRWINGN